MPEEYDGRMLAGVIRKSSYPGWYVACEALGIYTQGTSREDACAMLADAVEMYVEQDGFTVSVTVTGELGEGEYAVSIESEQGAALAAAVERHRLEMRPHTDE
jgi:predicted RNase H-like HicB family nuclease